MDIPFGAPDNIKETIDYILGCIEQGYTIDKDGPQSDFLVLENALVKTMKLQQILFTAIFGNCFDNSTRR